MSESTIAALAAAAHELRVLLDAIPAPVFYKDAAGIYRGCNQAFEAYLGRPRASPIRPPPARSPSACST